MRNIVTSTTIQQIDIGPIYVYQTSNSNYDEVPAQYMSKRSLLLRMCPTLEVCLNKLHSKLVGV